MTTLNGDQLTAKKAVAWYSTLLLECLSDATDVTEAQMAAQLAYDSYPTPPDDILLSVDRTGRKHKDKGKGGGQFTEKGAKASTHPLAGMNREQVLSKLGEMRYGAQSDEANPWKYQPERVSQEIANSVLEEIRKQHTHIFRRPTIKQLYEPFKDKMDLHTFQSALAKLSQENRVSLGAYTQALAATDADERYDPAFLMPWDRDWKFYAGVNPSAALSAFFAHDIENPIAQGILNRTLKVAKRLSADARKEFAVILKIERPREMAQALVAFLLRYRSELGRLLNTTQLASILEGAMEVGRRIPPIPSPGAGSPPPPTLPPDDAQILLKKLQRLEGMKRAEAIYKLPADQQQYVKDALSATAGTPAIQPPFTPPLLVGQPEPPESIHYPIIEEAAKGLAQKNVVTRQEFDELDNETRTKAFTVTGVDAAETLQEIKGLLSESIREGDDLATFREKALEAVGEDGFLSDAHLENVFRTNIQMAFSDGQMKVLSHPYVRKGFPYADYNAIHDDRVRQTHLDVEKLGLDNTNVFRIDDPVFQTFRPPWEWMCRCSWNPLTIRMAAGKGVKEAQQWLETGVEPSPPAFVTMPSFQPPAGFQRAIVNAPLSIRLSVLPVKIVSAAFAVDAKGHDHAPKGTKEGGQFVGKVSQTTVTAPKVEHGRAVQSHAEADVAQQHLDKRVSEIVSAARDKMKERGEENKISDAQILKETIAARLSTAFSHLPRQMVKNAMMEYGTSHIYSDVEGRATTDTERLAAGLIGCWARTSGDTLPKALAIQKAVQSTFGLEDVWEPGTPETSEEASRLHEEHERVLTAFVKAMYRETQAHLQSMGVNKLTLVRGYGDESFEGGDVSLSLQPLSSFTSNYTVAEFFGQNIIIIEVPANRIVSTCATGFGCWEEDEFTVLGGTFQAHRRPIVSR